jgi:hypothetical protein
MPERADFIAVLIIDRPLCLECIAAKTGMSAMSVKGYLERLETTVTVHRAHEERCRACGMIGDVFSLPRKE